MAAVAGLLPGEFLLGARDGRQLELLKEPLSLGGAQGWSSS